jgi:hypothetical protein
MKGRKEKKERKEGRKEGRKVPAAGGSHCNPSNSGGSDQED